jgi:HD superfamily phosphohydrolase
MIQGSEARKDRSCDLPLTCSPDVVAFDDRMFHDLIETPAFQRLRFIRFLGGIDYLLIRFPNGANGNTRHTRYQHSLGVARLALLYCDLRELPSSERRHLFAAALLHDVGHAPLSHSLEPVFLDVFGLEHHQVTADIISGRLALGREVYETLRRYEVDVERVLAILARKESDDGGFFSGPINFDTIEGIIRTHSYARPSPGGLTAEAVMKAAMYRQSTADRDLVDEFWLLKDQVYRSIIKSRAGVLADSICQTFMRRHIASIKPDDYFSAEPKIFAKLPRLRSLLTSSRVESKIAEYVAEPIIYEQRRFFIERSADFFERMDACRYKQARETRVLVPPRTGERVAQREQAEVSLMADGIERAKRYSEAKLADLRNRSGSLAHQDDVVLTCGSYARREASRQSDIDFFIITSSETHSEAAEASWAGSVRDAIAEIVPVEAAPGGAFSKVELSNAMVCNIGGENDSNQKITDLPQLMRENGVEHLLRQTPLSGWWGSVQRLARRRGLRILSWLGFAWLGHYHSVRGFTPRYN